MKRFWLKLRIKWFHPEICWDHGPRELVDVIRGKMWICRSCGEGTPEEKWLRKAAELEAAWRMAK